MDLTELRNRIRSIFDSDLSTFRRRGQDEAAALAASYRDDVLGALEDWWTAELTLDEAAEEAPWTAETIGRKLGNEIPQAGRPYKPRVRRCDLREALAGSTSEPENEPPVEAPGLAEEQLREEAVT